MFFKRAFKNIITNKNLLYCIFIIHSRNIINKIYYYFKLKQKIKELKER